MNEREQDLRATVAQLHEELERLRVRVDRLAETVGLLHEELRRLYEEAVATP